MSHPDNVDPRDNRPLQNDLPPNPEVNEPDALSSEPAVIKEGEEKNFNLESERTEAPHIPDAQSKALTMEVHHHGHVHEKKKWKEYVFQFFMLFLAVFCGFLAEYQLEHTIEHNREKQFMLSLVKDLESDTAQLNNIKVIRLRNLTRIDSALRYLVTHQDVSIPFGQMRNMSLGLRSFYQNSGTLDQLKNAGGLRLVRKRNIVDSISGYDQQVKRMVLRDQYETDQRGQLSQTMQKMLDGKILAKIYVDTTIFHQPAPSLESPIVLNRDYLGEYLNGLLICRNVIQNNLLLQDAIKGKAERLINLIKKEY